MIGLVAEIALQGATFAFDKLYTYTVPPELCGNVEPGKRVLVPFGRGNIQKQGIVFSLKRSELRGLKNILSVVDKEPLLTEEMIKMCVFMQDTAFCTYYDAVNAMLPAGLGIRLVNYYSENPEFSYLSLLNEDELQVLNYLKGSGETAEDKLISTLGITKDLLDNLLAKEAVLKSSDAKRRLKDATQKWVRIKDEGYLDMKLTSRQKEVLELLESVGSAAVKEICYFTGASSSVIEGLIKKDILTVFEKQIFRNPINAEIPKNTEDFTLTDEQQKAFEGLEREYLADSAKVSLLYGVTGSGKTRVFLKLADRALADGKGVIVMVPEIALTPQLISIFTARYGKRVAVFHSAMSMGSRMDEWQRIKKGDALIAVGTRSAIFAPFKSLGLIIIDEEQEHTYKSEKSPRFHTRELAKFRINYHKGLLCLASATPSIESYTLAKNGKYSLFTLTERYGNASLPTVTTVDMKKELMNGNSGILSEELYNGVKNALKNGNQVILLLNRRGHNTYISCPQCGYVATCPNCSISLTYHSANNRMMCHYCGYSVTAERVCPECGGKHIKFSGLGTQKAEEELKQLFPDANILRLDADSTLARDSFSSYLTEFGKGNYDILLGTQMVAKGLDFPNVTLVGVLGADAALYSEDYKSFERTFSLLTQVVGRAGRGENHGTAVIQTNSPDSEIITLAKNQDYEGFYEEEILTRKLMIYPPYCDICALFTQSINKASAEKAIYSIFEEIKRLANGEFKNVKLIILGPSVSPLAKINNRYRFRMIIKCKMNGEFRKMLRQALEIKIPNGVTVSVDVNPETVI